MKIEIQGSPTFRFKLTLEQINVLIISSRGHYDATCRRASDPDASDHEGFLCKWRRLIETVGEEYVIRAKFRDLDICLKILEMAPREKVSISSALTCAFYKALSKSNECVMQWRAEIVWPAS